MLITDTYRDLNARQHFERPEWGRQSIKWWETVRSFCDQLKVKKFLDYGCGKGMLKEALERFGYEVACYDPAFPATAALPDPHDFVVCMDVLEHIEPECLDDVLSHLRSVTLKCAFFVVAVRPARQILADGRNAHLIVQPIEWWMDKLGQYFLLGDPQEKDGMFAVLADPKAVPVMTARNAS